MNILSNLKPAPGSIKKGKRIGRGQGSGKGGTSTKGHKGAQARTGYSVKAGFEGGQMPMARRLPKFGFKNPFRVEYVALNLSLLQKISETHGVTHFDNEAFKTYGIASKTAKVKILAKGTLTSAITVVADGFSEKARHAIEAAGGTITKTSIPSSKE